MKKRFLISITAGLLFAGLLIVFLYLNSLVEETVEKAERAIAKRLSLDAKIDAEILFFPPSLKIKSIVLKKSEKTAATVENCESGELLDFVKNRKVYLNCKNAEVDLETVRGLFHVMHKKADNKKAERPVVKPLKADVKIADLKVKYQDIEKNFSFAVELNNKEGVLRLRNIGKLREKGFIEAIFSIPERKADVRFESIELENFAKLVHEFSNISLLLGKMSGTLRLSMKDDFVLSENDIVISGFSVLYPLIDTEKFSIPFLRFVGNISAGLSKKDLAVENARVSLGGIEGSFSGKYSSKARSFDLDLKKIELNKLETVVRNDVFKEYLFGGKIDLEIKYRSDIELGSSFSLIGNVIDPVQLSKRLNYLNLPFSYSFTDQFEKIRTFHVGPGNVDFTDMGSIPDHLKWAVLVSEDAGFYVHQGVDFKEIDAAVKDNMKKKRFRGGSTITQQLAKNLFLKREKTMVRKLREAILAVELDATLTKRRQLEIYLNIIEWGPGVFGVSEASWYYFGKTPMELTPLESSYLASIIPGPIKYNVHFRKKKISAKWEKKLYHILGLMNETGHLDLSDYYDALSGELIFREN